jgi:hypothetical protein
LRPVGGVSVSACPLSMGVSFRGGFSCGPA